MVAITAEQLGRFEQQSGRGLGVVEKLNQMKGRLPDQFRGMDFNNPEALRNAVEWGKERVGVNAKRIGGAVENLVKNTIGPDTLGRNVLAGGAFAGGALGATYLAKHPEVITNSMDTLQHAATAQFEALKSAVSPDIMDQINHGLNSAKTAIEHGADQAFHGIQSFASSATENATSALDVFPGSSQIADAGTGVLNHVSDFFTSISHDVSAWLPQAIGFSGAAFGIPAAGISALALFMGGKALFKRFKNKR